MICRHCEKEFGNIHDNFYGCCNECFKVFYCDIETDNLNDDDRQIVRTIKLINGCMSPDCKVCQIIRETFIALRPYGRFAIVPFGEIIHEDTDSIDLRPVVDKVIE
jgi:hypothetical protein